jgi:hypothetical protein
MKYIQYCCIMAICLFPATLFGAISIDVIGDWNKSIGSSDLQSGAGSDLISSHESATDQLICDVSNTAGTGDTWRIDVKKSNISWNENVHLYMQRTTDGTGFGSISGGSSYIELSDTDQAFFEGSGDRNMVALQLKVDGITILLGQMQLSCSITYTIVDT